MKKLCLALLLLCSGAHAASLLLTHAATIYADANGQPLKAPEGVACTAKGQLVVADSGNGRLLTFSYDGGKMSGGAEIKFEQLGVPTRVQIDSRGNVLALDQKGKRIVRVGLEGKFAGFVELKGVPVESGFMPVAFKLDRADNAWVVDVISGRVVEVDRAGAFVREIQSPRGVMFSDVAPGPEGEVYAVDPVGAMVWVLAKGSASFAPFSGKLKEYLDYPMYLTVTDRRQLMLVDEHGQGLVMLGHDGSFQGRQLAIGWTEGNLYYPGQVCLDGRGDVFVADRNNNRVQAFSAEQ